MNASEGSVKLSQQSIALVLLPLQFDSLMFRFVKTTAANFLSDESGPTSVEYAIMLALIVAVCITGILTTGDLQQQLWSDTASDMESAINRGGN